MEPHFTLPRVTLCKCCVMCNVLVWAARCHGDECRPATTLALHTAALRDEQITAPLTRLRTLQIYIETKYILFRVSEHLIEIIGF